MARFCVHYTNGTDELFDGEDVHYEEDYVVFTVSVNGRETMVRAVAVDKGGRLGTARPLGRPGRQRARRSAYWKTRLPSSFPQIEGGRRPLRDTWSYAR